MTTIREISEFMERTAPLALAESWDNVGLLLGDPDRTVTRIMTCLTVTSETVEEAVREEAELIIPHHPCPFQGVKQITTGSPLGRILLQLLEAKVAVYSAHTAFDSASEGINQRIAEGIGLSMIQPLIPQADPPEGSSVAGVGRVGMLTHSTLFGDFAQSVKEFFGVEVMQIAGASDAPILTVAIACGAAGELIGDAKRESCDAMILGETKMHSCLDAIADGLCLCLPGHFASERFAMDELAVVLAREFPELFIWASQEEDDPLGWL
jgi:dinuclear metal center YbgI/SA1388 family protein